MDKVTVLMSTYNGEKYIKDQIVGCWRLEFLNLWPSAV